MQKPALLRIVDQFGVDRLVPVKKRVFTIGRSLENDLHLLSNSVSRDHAAIVYDNDTYYLVDKGSKSGLFINGQRVTRCELHHQDKIGVGGHEGQVEFLEETLRPIVESADGLNLSHSRRAAAVSAKEELQRLARYVEVNQAFKFSLTLDDVLCLIVDAAIEMADAERGCLLLRNDGDQLEFKIARDNKRNLLSGPEFQLSRTVVSEAFDEKRTVVVKDYLEGDQNTRHSVFNLNLRSIVCVPLRHFQISENGVNSTEMATHKIIGVLYVDSRKAHGEFSKSALTLLESLAFEASKSLESMRLMQQEQEKMQLEHEFATAREVQLALLPTTFEQPAHFEVSAHSIPCRYVGGDFYDLFTLQDGRSVVILGDVSGKGISAALLASMAQGVIQAQFNSGLSLQEVLASLNRVLVGKSDEKRFLTLFCALIASDGAVSFINAGHNPPILFRSGGAIEYLSSGSMMLGAFDFAEYHPNNTKLEPGDVLVIFSDGVTEAVNQANELFGELRLERLVRKSAGLNAQGIKDRITQGVLNFTEGLSQRDDTTLLVLKMRSFNL
ncbi:MAG TPA: SpoIIE family protein phosphatase [Pyrinomonadaceae bacterium]|nr:SpoIIE family protein phosphatase [Pyrinomonadaceae bacterium]